MSLSPWPDGGLALRVANLPLLGPMLLAADDEGLGCFSPASPGQGNVGDKSLPAQDLLEQTEAEVREYLAGKRAVFTIPLAPIGTEFQRRVWKALLTIPFGETRTYGEIAEQVGGKNLARAVGGAVGANPLPVFVPCHRVTAAGGRLGGYSLECDTLGGPELKRRLLDLERGVRSLLPGKAEEAGADNVIAMTESQL